MIYSKGASFGYVQKNSLIRNSQIINSSIIINVFVNAKNGTDIGLGSIQLVPDDPNEETTEGMDSRFDFDQAQPYQKPDIGMIMIEDRYMRPHIRLDATTEEPAN